MKPKQPTLKRTPRACACAECGRKLERGTVAQHMPAGAWTPAFWICRPCQAMYDAIESAGEAQA